MADRRRAADPRRGAARRPDRTPRRCDRPRTDASRGRLRRPAPRGPRPAHLDGRRHPLRRPTAISGSSTPIVEMDVGMVTPAERDSYARFRETYQQRWVELLRSDRDPARAGAGPHGHRRHRDAARREQRLSIRDGDGSRASGSVPTACDPHAGAAAAGRDRHRRRGGRHGLVGARNAASDAEPRRACARVDEGRRLGLDRPGPDRSSG